MLEKNMIDEFLSKSKKEGASKDKQEGNEDISKSQNAAAHATERLQMKHNSMDKTIINESGY